MSPVIGSMTPTESILTERSGKPNSAFFEGGFATSFLSEGGGVTTISAAGGGVSTAAFIEREALPVTLGLEVAAGTNTIEIGIVVVGAVPAVGITEKEFASPIE